MATVIKFPPEQFCALCSTKLRPATQKEIAEGRLDPKLQHIFNQAVQGNVERTFLNESEVSEWMKYETAPGSWLLICDKCGMKCLYGQPMEL
jgi:hypothetical protein